MSKIHEPALDHAETERLVRGYEEHQKEYVDAVERKHKAEKDVEAAAHEAQRWDKALTQHFETIKAAARLRAKGEM